MSFLDQVAALNNYQPGGFMPFEVEGRRVGRVRPTFAEALTTHSDVFSAAGAGVTLHRDLVGFDERTDAVAGVLAALVDRGVIRYLQGESYPVTLDRRDQALFAIDRGTAGYFGVRTFGQHLNGYVRKEEGIHLWIARRARDRRIFPGRLDNLVAGGLPHGLSLRDNLLKECYEEAAIPRELASRACPVGIVNYNAETEKGFKPDVLYCYDLELPEDFQPYCTDGEVEAFYLMPVSEVMAIVAGSDEFKPNCNLVMIDFFIRHGLWGPESADYMKVVQGLRAEWDAPI